MFQLIQLGGELIFVRAVASPRRRSTTARPWSTATASCRSWFDFYGPEGRHLGQHPGVPAIGEKTVTPSSWSTVRRPRRRPLEHRRDISGAKRKENLTDHAEAARTTSGLPRRSATRRATSIIESVTAREPDRARLREVFREFELRDPLRRLEEALATTRPRPRASGPPSESRCGPGRSLPPPWPRSTAS